MLFDDRLEIKEYGMNDDYMFYNKKWKDVFVISQEEDSQKFRFGWWVLLRVYLGAYKIDIPVKYQRGY